MRQSYKQVFPCHGHLSPEPGWLPEKKRAVIWGMGAVEPKHLSSEISNNENTPHSLFPPTSQYLISTVLTLLIPKYFNINSSEVTAGFLSAINRWQPRRVLFPSCQLGGRLTCCHLKHRSLTPARRRLPSTTKILPGCPLISILKSTGGKVSLQLR